MDLVGQYARQVRQQRKLRAIDVALQMGLWENLSKGVNRITKFEERGEATQELFDRLREVLRLDSQRIQELLAEEERLYQAWMDEPVPMALTVRIIPAVYLQRKVPEGLSREQAIEWALAEARRQPQFRMCLHLSRRERIWIKEGGQSFFVDIVKRGREDLPSMRIGRHRFRFVQE